MWMRSVISGRRVTYVASNRCGASPVAVQHVIALRFGSSYLDDCIQRLLRPNIAIRACIPEIIMDTTNKSLIQFDKQTSQYNFSHPSIEATTMSTADVLMASQATHFLQSQLLKLGCRKLQLVPYPRQPLLGCSLAWHLCGCLFSPARPCK